jgi:carbonic anhydrase/acetyltransferase-like protein (isoleucine patch superfamily)
VTEGKEYPDRSLIVGAPAKAIRTLDEATAARIGGEAMNYVNRWKRYAKGLRRID